MTRATISPVVLTKIGYNLTDSAGFTTLSTGAGNGVQFTFDANDIIILKNGSGLSADFTILVPTETDLDDKGITTPDVTVTVADGKTWIYQPTSIFKQSDGLMYIDCDQATDVLVLSPT